VWDAQEMIEQSEADKNEFKLHTRRILLRLYKNVFGFRRFLIIDYWKMLFFGC
jgi:hypothetical protein